MPNIAEMKAELNETQNKSETLSNAHRAKSISELRLNRNLGVAVTILAVLIGPSAISSSQHLTVWNLDIMDYVTGGLSLIAAILSGTQTVLNPAQSSQDHKEASDGYGSLSSRITIWENEYTSDKDQKTAFLSFERLLTEFDQITEQAPPILVRI